MYQIRPLWQLQAAQTVLWYIYATTIELSSCIVMSHSHEKSLQRVCH